MRNVIGDTGFCRRWYPPALASRSRSGAVSPLMRKAGTGVPSTSRRRSMTLDAGLTIGETKVGDDQIQLSATVHDAGKGGCA